MDSQNRLADPNVNVHRDNEHDTSRRSITDYHTQPFNLGQHTAHSASKKVDDVSILTFDLHISIDPARFAPDDIFCTAPEPICPSTTTTASYFAPRALHSPDTK
jgi:hypothetical protein